MTGPLGDVYARARLIWAEATRRNEAGEPTTYNAESAEHEADDDPWIGDDRWLQEAADNWTERELS